MHDSTTNKTQNKPPSKRLKRHSKKPESAAGNAPNHPTRECPQPQHQQIPPQQRQDGFGSSTKADPLDNPAVLAELLELFQGLSEVSSETMGSSNNDVPPAARDSRTHLSSVVEKTATDSKKTQNKPPSQRSKGPEVKPEGAPRRQKSGSGILSMTEEILSMTEEIAQLEEATKREVKLREKAEAELAMALQRNEDLSIAFAHSDSDISTGYAASPFSKENIGKMQCLVCSCKDKGVAAVASTLCPPSAGSSQNLPSAVQQPTVEPLTSAHTSSACSATQQLASNTHGSRTCVTAARIIPTKESALCLQKHNLLTKKLTCSAIVCEDRNVVPLCGSHGEKGTCHHKFDELELGFFKRGHTGSMTSESGITLDDGSTSQKNEWVLFEIGSQEGSAVDGKRKLTIVTIVDFQDYHPRRSVTLERSKCALRKAGLSVQDLVEAAQKHTAKDTYQRIMTWLHEAPCDVSDD